VKALTKATKLKKPDDTVGPQDARLALEMPNVAFRKDMIPVCHRRRPKKG
jgi:hypothetical protein